MDIKKQLLGATIASTVALAFTAAPLTLAMAAQPETKACYGVNSCKGTSACKTSTHACKGQNSCKGQGFLMKTPKQCAKMGGSLTESSSANTMAAPESSTNTNGATASASGMGTSQ